MPKTHVTRSIDIDKKADEVFALISDFTHWPTWSPWIIVEPDATLTFEEDGSAYSWRGNLIGSGSIRREHETAPQELICTLKILRPWKATSTVTFTLEETDGGCTVTWTMDGTLPLPLFWMKGMMECMVGMDYQRGLMMLKDIAETGEVLSKSTVMEHVAFEGFSYVGVENQCPIQEVGASMEQDFARIIAWSEESGTPPSGAPFTLYSKWNMGKGTCTYTLGFPIEELPEDLPDTLVRGELASCDTYVVEHTGPYHHLGNAWSIAMIHARNKKFPKLKGRDPFELYVNDPRETKGSDLVTRIHFPRS